MPMTPDARSALSSTIRRLRSLLIDSLHSETEGTYRLSIKKVAEAGLPRALAVRRQRLEAWLDEQVRAALSSPTASDKQRERERARRDVEKQAAYTFLNRLVLLRLLEGMGVRKVQVLTGGWGSKAYRDTFRPLAAELTRAETDPTEGYRLLIALIFEELAAELPGLYGKNPLIALIPINTAAFKAVVDALDAPELASCWDDEMTLGWVYQYWNDPEREDLDKKLHARGKLEPHEIASKTQMFTERYMVDWLLQNTLGPMWLAMCQKHGWVADCIADHTLENLENRRIAFRAQRASGEVPLTALMPLESELEARWAFYVPQPIPPDAVANAPASIRDLKLLDPAVGSGHFLVVAFELLCALYLEEARHRGLSGHPDWQVGAVVERILEVNLYGIDLDPRAVQIAAAALWLQAKRRARDARPKTMKLVSSALRLASLPPDDEALVELGRAVHEESGLPPVFTETVVGALRGADHLGSLLRVDAAVDEAIARYEREVVGASGQLELLPGARVKQAELVFDRVAVKQSVLQRLESFLGRHTRSDDLGLRLRGEQLAAGVRFARMVREGTYDVVVGNPPYQGTAKMAEVGYLKANYPKGKADLFAMFLERGLELVKVGGVSALLTMRNWMFIKQYAELRQWLLETYDLRALGDFAIGAFDDVPNDVLSVAVSVFRKVPPCVDSASVASQPTPPDDRSYDRVRTRRKRAATLAGEGRHEFSPAALKVVPEWPLVYWWSPKLLRDYATRPSLESVAPVRNGMSTQNNSRFLRLAWEVPHSAVYLERTALEPCPRFAWVPYIKGGEGRKWYEDVRDIVRWSDFGLEVKAFNEALYGSHSRTVKNESRYFHLGVAFTLIGSTFASRVHRYRSVFGHMGASVFPGEDSLAEIVCLLNSDSAQALLSSLNPGLHFLVGDVNRLPYVRPLSAHDVMSLLDTAFTEHESHREPSVEFKRPGPSPWRYAQAWAQLAVDRAEGAPLPEYRAEYDTEPVTDHVSFQLGVALGRFGRDGEGILDPASADLSAALPAGVLFLDGTLTPNDLSDGLGHPAVSGLWAVWAEHQAAIDKDGDLRKYLRTRFFSEVHRGMYDNRPIHWPLSSEKRTFVVWVTIHRMNGDTLRYVLAECLRPAKTRLEGELADLNAARQGDDKKAAREAEKRYTVVQKARDELDDFIRKVAQCAEKGPSNEGTLVREVDARYEPDLDDGVMINSAALWPLLEPQWKDPKKWWKELAESKGKKDYDWSHLAMRYWPTRVDKKCQEDPSLGVAHGSFWRYHPARAFAWELRLQDEIGPDFLIEEADHHHHRTTWLKENPEAALAAIEKEALRRLRKKKAPQPSLTLTEPGLWTTHPQACWSLELTLLEKQGADFHLLTPTDPTARETFVDTHPHLLTARQNLLATLSPPTFPTLDDDPDSTSDSDDPDPDGETASDE